MPNKEHAALNEELICKHRCDVTDNAAAWILLQEPGFIGFGAVYQDEICWPEHAEPLDWARIRDLRLFGEKGEWHVWHDWNGGWKSRLLKLEDIDEALTEYHVLWGDWPPKPCQPPWMKLTETRGTEIWLPVSELTEKLTESDFPLCLKLKQVIGYDDKNDDSSHLAGIIDAALVALVNRSGETVLYPPALSEVESNKVEAETSCSSGDASAVPS